MNPSVPLPFPLQTGTASETQADEEPPSGDLVTVTRVFNSLEAEMLRGCLEAEGIPASLGDDTLLTVVLGGIRVMVPASFADAARSTVAAFERGDLEIDELPSDGEAPVPEAETTSRIGLSTMTWVVLALVIVAVVVF